MEWFKHKREKISPKLRNEISTRDKGTCQVCGKKADYCEWKDGYWHCYEIITIRNDDYHVCFDIDHIVPICQGGTTHRDNLRLLCQKCNRSKGSKERRNGLV